MNLFAHTHLLVIASCRCHTKLYYKRYTLQTISVTLLLASNGQTGKKRGMVIYPIMGVLTLGIPSGKLT